MVTIQVQGLQGHKALTEREQRNHGERKGQLLRNKSSAENVQSVENVRNVLSALCKGPRHHALSKDRSSHNVRKAGRHSLKCKDLNVYSKAHNLQEVAKAEDPNDQDPVVVAEEVNQPS